MPDKAPDPGVVQAPLRIIAEVDLPSIPDRQELVIVTQGGAERVFQTVDRVFLVSENKVGLETRPMMGGAKVLVRQVGGPPLLTIATDAVVLGMGITDLKSRQH